MSVIGASLVQHWNVSVGPFRRSANDALRSLHKYVAEALGEEWEVRLWVDRGEFKPPFARVARVGAPLMRGTQRVVDVTHPFTVHCYPEVKETTEDALMEADRVEELLYDAFAVGIGFGYPMRIPLYNFNGVPLDGPYSDSLARREHDYIRIAQDSLNFDRLPDPTDDRLITVIANMRLMWRRPARQLRGKTVQSLQQSFTASG